jgi:hypothetical protein
MTEGRAPEPSGSPTPYTISNGWKAKEVEQGMDDDGGALYALRPVVTVKLDRGGVLMRGWIEMFCDFHRDGVKADVLLRI